MRRRRWRAYARLFEGERRLLAIGIAISILQSALLIPVALLVRRVFDTHIPRGDTDGLVVSGALILLLYLASAALGLVTPDPLPSWSPDRSGSRGLLGATGARVARRIVPTALPFRGSARAGL